MDQVDFSFKRHSIFCSVRTNKMTEKSNLFRPFVQRNDGEGQFDAVIPGPDVAQVVAA
jgi:hypothetical protein